MELYEFKKKLDIMLERSFDLAVETGLDVVPLPTNDFFPPSSYQSQAEKDAVMILTQAAKQLGGTDVDYAQGVFYCWFDSKHAAEDFSVYLDANASVDSYDIDVVSSVEFGTEEIDFDDIDDSGEFGFEVFAHLIPGIIGYMPVEVDDLVEDENGKIFEVRRVVKINSRGKRRIKMQCNPGYRWNASRRTCERITGAALVRQRLASRKAVRTKKAKGITFRARVTRKARRARKFRKSFGLR